MPLWMLFLVPVALVASSASGKGRPVKVSTRPGKKPVGVHRVPKRLSIAWSAFATGQTAALSVHVGDVPYGAWSVQLWIVQPRIDGGVKFGRKSYGYNAPPPGGTKVVSAVVSALNAALDVAGPVAETGAASLGVPPGTASAVEAAVRAIVKAIPNAARRVKVETWSRWRNGRWGSKSERARVSKAVSRWRDENPLYAMGQARQLAYWQWEGAGGELAEKPLSGTGKPIKPDPRLVLAARPTVRLELVGEGTATRVRVEIPETTSVPSGERRYVVVVSPA